MHLSMRIPTELNSVLSSAGSKLVVIDFHATCESPSHLLPDQLYSFHLCIAI